MSDERALHPASRAPLSIDVELARALLANSSDAIEVLDLGGRIAFVSDAAVCALAAGDADALVGTAWAASWRDTAQASQALTHAKTGTATAIEGERRSGDGKPTWWDATVCPILDADGKPGRLLVVGRDVSERRAAREAHQKLMQQMHHREKNVLAMAMAIASQSLARATSIAEGRMAVEQRLMALAEAHNLLREGGSDAVGLRRLVDRAIAPYDTVPSRLHVDGADLPLSSQSALAVAMAVHELCTNAVKHGALATRSGRVAIAWRVGTDGLHWSWRELDGAPVSPPRRRGFGLRVIEAGFRDQLRGRIEMSFAPSGLVCAVEVPLDALQGPAAG
ncbi:MAG TPA: HWE histidine kinase domain-containing protein [Xanthobacteraceae bacterium]|nr:HWE histidine kinase domain-containing protein [Xanthobacteraceae bacterium]